MHYNLLYIELDIKNNNLMIIVNGKYPNKKREETSKIVLNLVLKWESSFAII